MTKENKKPIAKSLATATCALLGTSSLSSVLAQEESEWDFDTALLYYGENDDRVQDVSLTLAARRFFVDDKSLSLNLVVDSLTGSSPIGATPTDTVQTFTRPSGRQIFDVAPGEFPLDDTFLDTRYALSVGWQQPLGRLFTGTAGVTFSSEYDYTHIGANFGLSRDFNKRNTTVSLGVAFAKDDMDPEGGTPVALTTMLDIGDLSNRTGDESKDVVDLLLGVTQVVNENFLVQVNYSFSDSSGYLSDPYKILSVIDPLTGTTAARTPAPGLEGPSHVFRYEGRPDSRTKHSLFTQGKYFMSGKVLDISYRFMTDDWEIDSHTLDAKIRFPIGDRAYIEPHVRYYTQSEAEFFQSSLLDGVPLPTYASADYRLAEFDAVTIGAKYGWKTDGGNDVSLRLEYYTQDGDIPANQIVGIQNEQDLYPGFDAVIFNFGYSFDL